MLLSIDDWLRILMDEERRWLRSQRRLFHTTKVLKRIEDFIKLLEHSYAEGYCNISMLMKMYIQAANIVAVSYLSYNLLLKLTKFSVFTNSLYSLSRHFYFHLCNAISVVAVG
jgi:hypothetical protein